LTLKNDWIAGDIFTATAANSVATQVNTNTSDISGKGDASTNTATSVDGEVALFSATAGKTLKRATGSGIATITSGVLGTAAAGTDYVAPGGALGTPSSGTLTSCTGLPISGLTASTSTAIGVGSIELGNAADTTITRSSAGVLAVEGVTVPLNATTSVHTASSIELGHATDTTITRTGAGAIAVEGVAVLLSGGALGTPSTGTLSSCTGLPISGLTASTSTAIGVGSVELGHASDTTLSRSAAGVLAVEGVVVPSISSTNTLTNKRITPRVGSTASSATPTINTDSYDQYNITALAAAITSMTTNLSGTPTDGQKLMIRFKDNGTARAITWGASFQSSGVATLLATTVINKTHHVGLIYDSAAAKWTCIAVDAAGA
jgi:hypothetical protein